MIGLNNIVEPVTRRLYFGEKRSAQNIVKVLDLWLAVVSTSLILDLQPEWEAAPVS
jgi:hypothetical protein